MYRLRFRLALLVVAVLCRPAAADDCQTATDLVQIAADQVEELKYRETSTRQQIEAASANLAFATVTSLLEAQIDTQRALVAAWDSIVHTTRTRASCWPPGMAARVGTRAERLAADARELIEQETIRRNEAREAADGQVGRRLR